MAERGTHRAALRVIENPPDPRPPNLGVGLVADVTKQAPERLLNMHGAHGRRAWIASALPRNDGEYLFYCLNMIYSRMTGPTSQKKAPKALKWLHAKLK